MTETKGCGYLWWHADADADAGAEVVLLTGVAHARGGRLGAMQVLGSKVTVGSCADSATAASSRFVSVCDVVFLASSSNALDTFPRSSRVEGPGIEFAGVFGLSLN